MQEEKQAVYGIVFNNDKTEVLLIKRRDIPVWVLPGGGLDQGESPETGAVREVLEERPALRPLSCGKLLNISPSIR